MMALEEKFEITLDEEGECVLTLLAGWLVALGWSWGQIRDRQSHRDVWQQLDVQCLCQGPAPGCLTAVDGPVY
jgi:hypothetical protein